MLVSLTGILVKIEGTEMSCQGHSCKEHEICGEVLKEDVVVRLRKMQLNVEGKEETAITAIWVMDGINHCHVGFIPRHIVRQDTTRRSCRSPAFLVEIRRPATWRSDACFLRTKGFTSH